MPNVTCVYLRISAHISRSRHSPMMHFPYGKPAGRRAAPCYRLEPPAWHSIFPNIHEHFCRLPRCSAPLRSSWGEPAVTPRYWGTCQRFSQMLVSAPAWAQVVPPAQAWPHLSTLVLSWNKWKVGAGPPSQPGLQLDAGLTTDTARDFAFDDDFHLVYLKVANPRGKPIQGNVVHLNNNNKNQFIFSHSSLRYTCFRTGPGDSCWISQPNWKALWQVKASSHGRAGQEMESDTSGEGTVNEQVVNLLSQSPGAARVRVLGPRCPASGSTA